MPQITYLDGFDAEDNEAPDSEADDDGEWRTRGQIKTCCTGWGNWKRYWILHTINWIKLQWIQFCNCIWCNRPDDDEDGEEGAGPVGDYDDDEDDDEEGSEGGEVGLSYLMKDEIQVMQI